ncbi:MAG: hypothetical protein MJ229_01830 [bacterium]|nr:hypothetical protein [bacterium]
MKLVPKEIIEQREFKSSSSNNIYITTLYSNCVSCTCPAGGKKQMCKHIKKIVFDNIEKIKTINPEFYDLLQTVLEACNSKILTQEEKREIYSKIVSVDKGVAEAAYLNSILNEIKNFDALYAWSENKALKFIESIDKKINQHKEWLKQGFIDEDTYIECVKKIMYAVKIIYEHDYDYKIDKD